MLNGIGIDIVETERVRGLLQRYGERFIKRVLTDNEEAVFNRRGAKAAFLASRFAAKEAASKALGTGMRCGVGFKSFELVNDSLGKPQLVFHGEAELIRRARNISRVQVSLSDERHYAVAMVVLESV